MVIWHRCYGPPFCSKITCFFAEESSTCNNEHNIDVPCLLGKNPPSLLLQVRERQHQGKVIFSNISWGQKKISAAIVSQAKSVDLQYIQVTAVMLMKNSVESTQVTPFKYLCLLQEYFQVEQVSLKYQSANSVWIWVHQFKLLVYIHSLLHFLTHALLSLEFLQIKSVD